MKTDFKLPKKLETLKETVRDNLDGKDVRNYLLFIALLSIFLVGFYFFIYFTVRMGILPWEFVATYICFDHTNPNIFGMFLSSYMHDIGNVWHLVGNVVWFIVFSLLIGLIYVIKEIWGNPLPKRYLICVYSSILIIIPFLISMAIIIVSRIYSLTPPGCGFSGIVYSVIGVFIYLFYSSFVCLIYPIITRDSKHPNLEYIIYNVGHSICFMVFILAGVCALIEAEWIGNPGGVVYHVIGFVFGIIVAASLESILKKLECNNPPL